MTEYHYEDYEGRQLEGDLTADEEAVVAALVQGVPKYRLSQHTGVARADVDRMLLSDWLNRIVQERYEEQYTCGHRMLSVAFPRAIICISKIMAEAEKDETRLRAAETLIKYAVEAEQRMITHVKIGRIQAQLAGEDTQLDKMSPEEQMEHILKRYAPSIAQKRGEA